MMPSNGRLYIVSNSTSGGVNSGQSFSLVGGDYVVLEWSWTHQYALLFPLMFAVGMIGLGFLFISPMYGIYKYRKGDKMAAIITMVVLGTIGIALTVAWLWGG
jgi:hypothetical protein